jgi:group II intron reverse transcriptase/maturase
METKLNLITRRAKEDKSCKFNNLMHLVNFKNLEECFRRLKKGKATGVDGTTIEEYEKNLRENLESLIKRMKKMSYRPQPVRRVYIPKDNGKERPLGIPTVEDKLVQMAFTRILEAIYEPDFIDFSYGFRRNRNCHQALARINKSIMFRPVNYIIDADIKGFFDNVNHDLLRKCIEFRVSDRKFVRYIVRFLKSGIIEEGKYLRTEAGTPQGGIISPVLANIYLHYILDLWFVKIAKPQVSGYIEMVRYADDFIICTENKEEAELILEGISKRLGRFGLELSEEKTRIVEFGRRAFEDKDNTGNRPGTFNFLGFTHFCTKSRKGKFKVGRKTEKNRFSRGVRKVKSWMKCQRNRKKLNEIWGMLSWILIGHYRYYGVSENSRQINHFYDEIKRIAYIWLNRRSQRRSFSWESFQKYLKTHPLPKPRIYNNLYNYVF